MDKTYDFIVNLHSRTGKAKEIWESLEEILIKDGVSYRVHITEYVGHATKIAEDLTADDAYHFLVVAGGDGTINEVLNGIRDLSKVSFGYLLAICRLALPMILPEAYILRQNRK